MLPRFTFLFLVLTLGCLIEMLFEPPLGLLFSAALGLAVATTLMRAERKTDV